MIVAGRVSQKMAPVLRQVYDQMMEPKWVISMGVCASTGGMFNNYAIVQGVDQVVPVDVYAPGLPAHARDADPRDHDAARAHRERRDHAPPRRDRRRRRRPRRGVAQAQPVPVDSRPGERWPTRRPTPTSADAERPRTHADRRRSTAARTSRAAASWSSTRPATSTSSSSGRCSTTATTCASTSPRSTTSPIRAARCPTASSPSASRSCLNLLDLERRARIRVRRPGARGRRRPCRRCSTSGPGTEAMEREVFDMFGIDVRRTIPTSPASSCRRTGSATRCARTTRRRIPVQFSARPRRTAASRRTPARGDRGAVAPPRARVRRTRAAQELKPRSELGPTELLREVGAVLRMSEAEAAELGRSTRSTRPRTRR